ncbi:hypothetical protein ACFWP2_36325 [Kitasatospora sp. NPDC058444]|uniref:hypothetical protein n=1 Tax=Kitasatospora sp. NPDC058444 TaxID=3346504 RepID=UPI003664AB44
MTARSGAIPGSRGKPGPPPRGPLERVLRAAPTPADVAALGAHARPAAEAGTRVGGSSALIRTPYRLSNGHGFYSRPERREGLYFPARDGAGTVVPWEKSWIADNDTDSEVFLCFDGRSFVDEVYITRAEDQKS